MFKLDLSLQSEILHILTTRFKSDFQIQSVDRLSAPERRNLILRIKLQSASDDVPKSLIFKQSCIQEGRDDQDLFDRFARDWAGLEFASQVPADKLTTPKFYGASLTHHFVLQQDFGHEHRSLIEPLTSNDRAAAMTALSLYMQRMAQFHANGHDQTDKYKALLNSINKNVEACPFDFDRLLTATKQTLKDLAVPFSDELEQELRSVFNAYKQPGPFTTFIHGDICPDNLFYDAATGSMHFIDFEWGSIGNALTDAAYIRMSIPTGWCVKAFLEEDIDYLEQVYRAELAKRIPEVSDDDQYNHALVAACAYWMVIQTVFIMWEVMEHERDISQQDREQPHPNWKAEDNLKRPQCLYRIKAFLNIASKHDIFPQLKQMAENVLQELQLRWPGTKELEVFPAFKSIEKKNPLTLTRCNTGLFKAIPHESFFKPKSNLQRFEDFTHPDPYGPGAIVLYKK